MQYFKWNAYNSRGESFNGTIEADTWQMAIMRLMQQKLFPSGVTPIEYSEYRSSQLADKRIDGLRSVKDKLIGNHSDMPEPRRYTRRKVGFVILIGMTLIVAAVLLVCHYCL
jgi:hypothetical protein